jgi:exodeoxyribonuclease-1
MTFYYYDLETSSGSARTGRIMQFAGQRTNELMEPIGEPDNILVKLSDDIIPEPDAILVHGITPQKTLEEGITEAELAEYFQNKIAIPGTVFVGYNNIRFDDEFMRYAFYRTFHEPYEWHWKNDRGRWDLLDAMRMMRALRPDGLKWPMLKDKPSVKLELMAKENGFLHENAHDALSDVVALIQLAKTFKESQPKLFDYLVGIKGKRDVAKLTEGGQPFVYTSGRLASEFEKTTVVKTLLKHPRRDAAIVYDLRHDPAEWIGMTVEQLVKHWSVRWGDDTKPLPVKTIQYNHCPALAPLGVLDTASKERIGYDQDLFMNHLKVIEDSPAFSENIERALDIMEDKQQSSLQLDDNVDTQLYDGFWGDQDRTDLVKIRHTDPGELAGLIPEVDNNRLRRMIPLYKARNFPKKLTGEERQAWESHRRNMLIEGGENSKAAKFGQRMQAIAKDRQLDSDQQYLLSELQLYVESILPEPEDELDQSSPE